MKYKFIVEGMVCGGCENRVKNALSMLEGVESVEASYKEGTVMVQTSSDIKKEIIDKIDDLGFEVVDKQ